MGTESTPERGNHRPAEREGAPGTGLLAVERIAHHDIPSVCALYKRVWDPHRSELPPELLKTLEPTPLEFTSEMEGVTYFAARRDGRTVGVVGLEMAHGSCHIVSLAVDPEARRQGIGRALVTTGIEWAKHNGASSIWVDPLAKFEAAAKLLTGLGFQPAGLLHRRLYREDVRYFELLLP